MGARKDSHVTSRRLAAAGICDDDDDIFVFRCRSMKARRSGIRNMAIGTNKIVNSTLLGKADVKYRFQGDVPQSLDLPRTV